MNKLLKKTTAIIATTAMALTLGIPAFADVTDNTEKMSETYTLEELVNDPSVSFMDDNSIFQTFATNSSYTSYIDVGVNASVYGQKRSYDAGNFGSRVYNIQCDSTENNGTLKVSLCKVNAFGSYSPQASDSKSINDKTTSATYNLGYQKGGDWAFQYTTIGSLKLYADVTMYSN